MASSSTREETVWYNVYKVYFTQASGPDHEAIALVPAQLPDQLGGRFYHVKGVVGLGMEYQCRPSYYFGGTRTYKKSDYLFQMPRSYLPQFEDIARNKPPPYDPRALTERNPNPPVRDCADWTEEVLEDTKNLLRANGMNV